MIFNPWVTETTDGNTTAEELESRRMAFVCVKMVIVGLFSEDVDFSLETTEINIFDIKDVIKQKH